MSEMSVHDLEIITKPAWNRPCAKSSIDSCLSNAVPTNLTSYGKGPNTLVIVLSFRIRLSLACSEIILSCTILEHSRIINHVQEGPELTKTQEALKSNIQREESAARRLRRNPCNAHRRNGSKNQHFQPRNSEGINRRQEAWYRISK